MSFGTISFLIMPFDLNEGRMMLEERITTRMKSSKLHKNKSDRAALLFTAYPVQLSSGFQIGSSLPALWRNSNFALLTRAPVIHALFSSHTPTRSLCDRQLDSFHFTSQIRPRLLPPTTIMAQVKPDPDAMYIKPDPDSKEAILADLEDDDIYEDAGDLDFSASAQNVWLSRLPQQLWDHWATIDENADDDEEIEIGTIRIEGEPGDLKRVCLNLINLSSSWVLTLHLDSQVSLRLHKREGNEDIPKDYTLQKQSMSTNAAHMTQNTFVFTEKDIPGAENRLASFGEKRSALYEAMKRDARRRQQGKKWEPYVRKTVPSVLYP